MKAIVSIDKKSTKLATQNILRKAFSAWEEANIFLKNETPNIKWADRPLINLTPERKARNTSAPLNIMTPSEHTCLTWKY